MNPPHPSTVPSPVRSELLNLLERWQMMKKEGKTVTAREVCADCPELAAELEQWANYVDNLERLAQSADRETSLWVGNLTPEPPDTSEIPLAYLLSSERYEILDKLGSGGMGAVYRAKDRMLDREVALKVIRPDIFTPALRARFQEEARAVARLDHPHIVKVFDVGEFQPPDQPGPVPFLTLEYVERGSLAAQLAKRRVPSREEQRESAKLLAMLARAMQHAHERGIVHRDLKPENVLLAPPSDLETLNTAWGCPKIGDFGLARSLQSEDRLTSAGAVMGTPAYMAPEQADGMPHVGAPADIFALGVILYEMLTGKLPFEAASRSEVMYKICKTPPIPPRKIRGDLCEELERICLDCLAKSPAQRPTAAELAARLDRWLRKEEAASSARPMQKLLSRRGVLMAGLGVATAGLGGVLSWRRWMLAGQEPNTPPEEKPSGPATAITPLKIRSFRVEQYREIDKEHWESMGVMGIDSMVARWGDATRLRIELSEAAHLYVVGFNFDGKEQLLWPRQKEAVPPRRERLQVPEANDALLVLNDDEKGGMQAYAVLASRRPLPAYQAWQKGVDWKKWPAGRIVWTADEKGVSAWVKGQGPHRGQEQKIPGAPPLAELCRALLRDGVEVVEMLAFPVQAKEEGR